MEEQEEQNEFMQEQAQDTPESPQSNPPKKVLRYVLAVILLVVLGVGVWFLYGILRGVGGAILPPSENIREFPVLPIDLPADFEISLFAENVANARVLVFDPEGRVVVSQTKKGSIIALPDENRDGKAETTLTVVEGLNNPHGMFFNCVSGGCNLYVAEEDKVSVYSYDTEHARVVGEGKMLFSLPSGGNHTTRTILPYKENGKTRMFVSIGSSCNVCAEEDDRRAKIFTANLDGSDFREFARGLRNSVFMAVHPETGELWATDMGRDLLGEDYILKQLTSSLTYPESEIGKELTYAFLETPEFQYRLEMRDKFVRDILDYPHEKLIDKIGL